ncbi:hypothetical protein Strvi_4698 [Streptomyces violaceusniger Tu 4113]|uniref:Uncharacterized protein n=1 Tax=Streptomyces violaceusniger (strain Tu 4113) TaxID=653045 RepID=G2PFD3_STRV4|nr:hypothetical protein Strvi_4698 [Streptomyces violaceusniger Tu 4113]
MAPTPPPHRGPTPAPPRGPATPPTPAPRDHHAGKPAPRRRPGGTTPATPHHDHHRTTITAARRPPCRWCGTRPTAKMPRPPPATSVPAPRSARTTPWSKARCGTGRRRRASPLGTGPPQRAAGSNVPGGGHRAAGGRELPGPVAHQPLGYGREALRRSGPNGGAHSPGSAAGPPSRAAGAGAGESGRSAPEALLASAGRRLEAHPEAGEIPAADHGSEEEVLLVVCVGGPDPLWPAARYRHFQGVAGV